MSLSSALVSSNAFPDAETEVSSSQSPITSGSPVTPPRYPTAELSSDPRKLRPSSSRAQHLETFEDLLKEAGYSHTRVITPKAERLAKDAATYSSHTRDDSNDKGANGADSALTGAARYAVRMVNFLAWVSGSTSAAAVEDGDSQNDAADNSKHQQNAQRDHSPTPKGAHKSRMGSRLPHSSSGSRLQPKPGHLTSSSYEVPFDSISPSLSSDTIITASATTSTMTVRPLKPKNHSPPMRHSNSSPQLKQPSPVGTAGSNTPRLLGSRRVPSHKSNQGSHRSSGKPGSSRPNKRSPLPDTWKESPRSTGRTLRRRHPSEKLLARTGSLSSRAVATTTRIQAMTSPVTVSCRSSSVGATVRHRRKQELPLLAPSAESGAWPWLVDTGTNGKAAKISPLPKMNIHAANGKLPLARTGSASSSRGFSSLSRNGSSYTTFSRVGSNSPYASISRAGTSGVASSNRGAGEENSWADYSHRNSPIVTGFKHLPHPTLDDKEHTDEGDDDSGDEPHLSNILAPHLSPLADAKPDAATHPGPVGRQRSIQSLRACLRRHKSVGSSRITSPNVATFPTDQVHPVPVPSLPVAGPNPPKVDHEILQTHGKRQSMGNYDQRRGREAGVAPSRRMFDDEGDGREIRRVEAVGAENETSERGRTDSRGLLHLGLNGLSWPASSSRSPPYSTPPPPSGVRGARTSSTPARGHDKRGKKDDKMNQKELERERLLWGTSWGRK